ncbi:MAG: hypothetical protein ABH806_01900 [Candidatus Omnitrophota bacterium]
MVSREPTVYLFIGQDPFSKDISFKKLKEDLIPPNTQHFNLDILYARDLSLKDLQERLMSLPFKAKKRLVIIKDAQGLKNDIKEFIVKYVKKPQADTVLVLDINKYLPRDEFIARVSRYGQVIRFKEEALPDAFALSRAIDSRKTGYALRVLNQLLRNGEKPERILGGLRYSWENNTGGPSQTKRKLRALLGCDIDIKSGKLRPDFALERLIAFLCGFAKPSS